MSALREVQGILRAVAVWFAWVLLTGSPFHDRSYGELRRLSAAEVALHVAPLAVVTVAIAHLYTSMASEFGYVLSVWMGLWAVSGFVLVGSTLVASRVVDWRLLHA